MTIKTNLIVIKTRMLRLEGTLKREIRLSSELNRKWEEKGKSRKWCFKKRGEEKKES